MSSTVKVGAYVSANDKPSFTGTVVADTFEAYPCPSDMFLIRTGPASDPWFTFGQLTGRTRRRWGYVDTPTINRFAVITTVTMRGDTPTIIGVPGQRLTGTWFCRPCDVVDSVEAKAVEAAVRLIEAS